LIFAPYRSGAATVVIYSTVGFRGL
jgi:hypothetical protein